MYLFRYLIVIKSIIFLFAKATTTEHSYTLPSLIQEFQNNFKIQWTAIIYRHLNEEVENVIKFVQIPKVIVNKITNENEVYDNLSQNVLTLAVAREHEVEEVNNLVQYFLKTKKFTHILWIYPEANMQDLWRLSSISWNFGNTKVLYYVQGNIYTYNPLPYIQVKRLKNFKQYAERGDIVDFQQYPLTFPVISNSPRCYRYVDHNGQMVNGGYMFEIMRIFMDQYNFKFVPYPYDYKDYSRIDLLRGLRNKSFDIVLEILFRHAEFAYSDVMWNNNLYVIVPYPKPLAKDKYFSHFTKLPTIFCTFALAASSTILFTLHQKPPRRDVGRILLYAFATLHYQFHFPLKQSKMFKYFLTFVLFFYALQSTTLFWSNITNLIASKMYEEKMQTIEGITKSPYEILISKADYDYMKQFNEIRQTFKKSKFAPNSVVKQHLFALNNSYIYIALEDRADYVLFQQRYLKVPLLYKLKIALYCVPIYFPLRHHLPYTELFNRYLKYLMDSGIMIKLLEDAKWNGVYSDYIKFFMDADDCVYLFKFEEFSAPLIFYLIMVALSFVVLLVELINHKLNSK